MANFISMDKRVAVITALVEGCSIRSTVRMTGVSKGAILRLLESVGTACTEFHNSAVRNVQAKRVQVDEIWSFVGCKQKNVTEKTIENFGICGDAWTFTAIDADSKLVIGWMVGQRDAGFASIFLQDIESRLANRIQLTTDGHRMYLTAVEDAFGAGIDYAMLVKIYGRDLEANTRYSPATCIGAIPQTVTGNPDPKHVSTSYVERQNLNMRMGMRRFTRLTNAFSKKIENHAHQVALFHIWYNFDRVHQTLRVTPAMEAGISSHVWSIQEIAALSAVAKGTEKVAA
jgi:IS1 family transposase